MLTSVTSKLQSLCNQPDTLQSPLSFFPHFFAFSTPGYSIVPHYPLLHFQSSGLWWRQSQLTAFSSRQVRSTTDTSGTGTRKAIPVSLPFSAGITFPTALAAPVDDGMMFVPAVRPPRQSLDEGPSTVFWVAVKAWTVVIKPSMMTKLSLITFASGARQLVVHDALLCRTDNENIQRCKQGKQLPSPNFYYWNIFLLSKNYCSLKVQNFVMKLSISEE